MIKYIALLFSVVTYMAHAGNVLTCLQSTAERTEEVVKTEVSNGDAQLLAEYIAGKAVPKLLANNDVNKFLAKTHIAATQNTQGGYDFSVLGLQVAQTGAQPDAKQVAATLVPHIAAAIVTAKNTQAPAAASGSQS